MTGKAKLNKVTATIDTLFLKITGSWEADDTDRKAAWELYVELVTRIAVQELKPGEGSLREALSSLHEIFDETRKILRKYGPAIGTPKKKGQLSLGIIALKVLNEALRPFLSKWHPTLRKYEDGNHQGISQIEYEEQWDGAKVLRAELKSLNQSLRGYANHLADVAGVPGI